MRSMTGGSLTLKDIEQKTSNISNDSSVAEYSSSDDILSPEAPSKSPFPPSASKIENENEKIVRLDL